MESVTRSSKAFLFFEHNYWNYYRELENEFLLTKRYVDFNTSNNNVFSVEYLKLYQAVCSEIDVIGKAMANMVNPNFKADDRTNNILKWWYEIQDAFFVTESPFSLNNDSAESKQIPLRDYMCCLNDSITLNPWKGFRTETFQDKKNVLRYRVSSESSTPQWWNDYNKVKHNRIVLNEDSNYMKANFKNLSMAFAALYTLEHSYMDMIGTDDDLQSFMDFSVLFVKRRIYTYDEMDKLLNMK